jgi:arylsulfatase
LIALAAAAEIPLPPLFLSTAIFAGRCASKLGGGVCLRYRSKWAASSGLESCYSFFLENVMRRFAFALSVLLANLTIGALSSTQAATISGARPNIVFIITDDQGYGDLSAHGNPVLKTPNLDRLHAEGVRFTDFHVSPTCSPTRSALMSGRHEFKNGVTHTILERERMSLDTVTLPQTLKTAGYTTGIFGKWHLGDEAEYQPNRRGFDEVFIHGGGGIGQTYPGSCGDAPGNRYFDPAILHNGKFEKTKGYCTDVFFAQAQKWIESRVRAGEGASREPFFCYIATNAPHGPLDARPEDEARYTGKVPSADVAKFFGMIANIDDNVGRLLAKLSQLGIERETLVVFMNDNGGTAGTKVFNAGMRGQKGTPYRGGTRAMSLWRWPNTLSPADCDRTVAHIDVYRTLADIAGAKLSSKAEAQAEGRNLVPLLENPTADWAARTLFTHQGRWPKGSDANLAKFANCSIRSGRWNLVSAGGGAPRGKGNGVKTNLPGKTQQSALRGEVVIGVAPDGALTYAGAPATLEQVIGKISKLSPERTAIVVSAAEATPYERVVSLISKIPATDPKFQVVFKEPVSLAKVEPRWELFDLAVDPGETKNLAAEHPEVIAELRKAYDAWWAEIVPATLENERAEGPAINPFHELYYQQFGRPTDKAEAAKPATVVAQAPAADTKPAAPAQPAAPRRRAPNPSLVKVTEDPNLPRVLLIGDSISMGYTLPVRELLKGKANVLRVPMNGGPTTNGLTHMKDWLGDGRWDVIHFNWGLHDLKFMPEGHRQVELDAYTKNLRELVKQMKAGAPNAKLIWCSTTPVPEGDLNPMRKNADVVAYNAAAAKVMAEEGVEIDDLYAFALPKLAEIQRPVNVHFHDEGSAVLAKQVAGEIEKRLPKK